MRIALSKPWIGDEEREAVLRALDSGNLVQGAEVEALEREWAAACGAKHAIATSSGTTALHVALLAHGVGPGDEVVTTPFTFIATVNAILHVGATPVFVDIEPDTYNLDASRIEAALSPRTKAILPVHLYGQPCDMAAIEDVARRRGLVIVEDAAQAMGASFDGRAVGATNTTCFSLYATKNVMSGEGGMITTNDADVDRTCRQLRSHGRVRKEEPSTAGFNFRMSELHAALGRAQLRRRDAIRVRRRDNAAFLCAHLEDVCVVPTTRARRQHAWHQFTVRARSRSVSRDAVVAYLREQGCEAGVFYGTPAHRRPYVPNVNGAALQNAELLANEVFSLPVHPLLERADLEEIVALVRAALTNWAIGGASTR